MEVDWVKLTFGVKPTSRLQDYFWPESLDGLGSVFPLSESKGFVQFIV